ncbi:hypothetical protein MKY82_31150 [Paenibacillus sp. FSL W7-1279]|uniref:hypothetical protein n=1 Tax=Paenibacillus sp. FSL W7-1279 TaxID=2921697 RepID=UPI0030D76910
MDKAKRPTNLANWNEPDCRAKAKGVQLHPTPHVLDWEEAGNGVGAVDGSFGDGLEPPAYRINKGLSGFHKTWMQYRKNYFFREILYERNAEGSIFKYVVPASDRPVEGGLSGIRFEPVHGADS